jgi:hypothetical protein
MTIEDVERPPFDPEQLRRGQPLNQALPATWRWVEGLPPQIRPLSLLDKFPRIANVLARTWPDAPSFAAYVDSLLQDRRGGRRGFPSDVRSELMMLRHFYGYRHLVSRGLDGEVEPLAEPKR